MKRSLSHGVSTEKGRSPLSSLLELGTANKDWPIDPRARERESDPKQHNLFLSLKCKNGTININNIQRNINVIIATFLLSFSSNDLNPEVRF